jgi:hypothetical protein
MATEVTWRKHHKSNKGTEIVAYKGIVEAELPNDVLFVRVTQVEFCGQFINAWGYQKVNKRRVIESKES